MSTEVLDRFTTGYIEAALWSSTDDDDEPLDVNYSVSDIAPATIALMSADCSRFQQENAELLAKWRQSPEEAGHDFWLTRNRHGAGFWDRYSGIDERLVELGDKLTEASHKFGEFNLYIGDDEALYGYF